MHGLVGSRPLQCSLRGGSRWAGHRSVSGMPWAAYRRHMPHQAQLHSCGAAATTGPAGSGALCPLTAPLASTLAPSSRHVPHCMGLEGLQSWQPSSHMSVQMGARHCAGKRGTRRAAGGLHGAPHNRAPPQQRLAGYREHTCTLRQCLAVVKPRAPAMEGGRPQRATSGKRACPARCHTHQTVVSKHPLRAANGFAGVAKIRRVCIASTCMSMGAAFGCSMCVWVSHESTRPRVDVLRCGPRLPLHPYHVSWGLQWRGHSTASVVAAAPAGTVTGSLPGAQLGSYWRQVLS